MGSSESCCVRHRPNNKLVKPYTQSRLSAEGTESFRKQLVRFDITDATMVLKEKSMTGLKPSDGDSLHGMSPTEMMTILKRAEALGCPGMRLQRQSGLLNAQDFGKAHTGQECKQSKVAHRLIMTDEDGDYGYGYGYGPEFKPGESKAPQIGAYGLAACAEHNQIGPGARPQMEKRAEAQPAPAWLDDDAMQYVQKLRCNEETAPCRGRPLSWKGSMRRR